MTHGTRLTGTGVQQWACSNWAITRRCTIDCQRQMAATLVCLREQGARRIIESFLQVVDEVPASAPWYGQREHYESARC